MDATNKQGHVWTGERNLEWWIYTDENGRLYESREMPAYRIAMNNATQIRTADGRLAISPIKR